MTEMVNEMCIRFSPNDAAANVEILLNSVAVRFSCYHVENIRKNTGNARFEATGENNYTAHCAHT